VSIDIETIDDVTVVKLAGGLDSYLASVARQQLGPILEGGGKMLLDMTAVEDITSAGLQLLLTIDRLIARSGGRIVLVGVADAVKDAISITGLLNLFTLCDTIDDGMKAL
jgi:anti-sigma B factor antagonist